MSLIRDVCVQVSLGHSWIDDDGPAHRFSESAMLRLTGGRANISKFKRPQRIKSLVRLKVMGHPLHCIISWSLLQVAPHTPDFACEACSHLPQPSSTTTQYRGITFPTAASAAAAVSAVISKASLLQSLGLLACVSD
jgi:hypothetical protein